MIANLCRRLPFSFRLDGKVASSPFGTMWRLFFRDCLGSYSKCLIATSDFQEYAEAVSFTIAQMKQSRANWREGAAPAIVDEPAEERRQPIKPETAQRKKTETVRRGNRTKRKPPPSAGTWEERRAEYLRRAGRSA